MANKEIYLFKTSTENGQEWCFGAKITSKYLPLDLEIDFSAVPVQFQSVVSPEEKLALLKKLNRFQSYDLEQINDNSKTTNP